jgi:hypothetical protein
MPRTAIRKGEKFPMGELKGLYIEEDLHREIKEMAAREGITIREAVEAILRRELKKKGERDGEDRRNEPTDGRPQRRRGDPGYTERC